jgi:hypothetical protein
LEPPPSASAELVPDLLRQARREKQWFHVRRWLAVLFTINYLLSILIKDHLPPSVRHIYQYASVILFFFGASNVFGILSRPTRGHKRLVQRISDCSAPDLTGPFVEAYRMLQQQGHSSARLCKPVSEALAERLQLVTEEDGKVWTAAQRTSLRDLLRTTTSVSILVRDVTALRDRSLKVSNPKLALGALAAIEQIGTREDLNVVAVLADSEANDLDARAVRAAAQRCLIVLEDRVDQLQKSETLLRPTESSESVLLRPSTQSCGTDNEQNLLRPESP